MHCISSYYLETMNGLFFFGKLLYTMPPFNCEELKVEHVKKIGDAMHSVVSKL